MDKDRLLKLLLEIGVDCFEVYDPDYDMIIISNQEYDVEERSFILKFDKETGKYFE